MNDRLSGYAAFPNFGESIDAFAGRVLRREFPPAIEALDLVGENGIPRFEDRRVRRMFYILAGSYAGYLVREWGREETHAGLRRKGHAKPRFKKRRENPPGGGRRRGWVR